ncbi:odorant receptor 2a-like [Diachasmimorpha longicaudata]|uniref:odorant receptor 2a-like n=1 Tax=Diachasmimorpha longicaudata TaxID=58733 RepID=UPI0030B8BCC1
MCLHVEKVYNVVVMCHLMNNLCFTSSALMLILTTWNDKQMGQVIIFGSTTIFLYGQIFLYSLVGEVMKTRSETLRYSVYNCRWYKLPLPERRKILFILTKMQKPMDFTAGNFYRLNLENFKNIVKFTVTLFSFLRLSLNK